MSSSCSATQPEERKVIAGELQEETRGRAPQGPALPAASAAKQNQPHLDFKYAPPDVKTLLLLFLQTVSLQSLMSLTEKLPLRAAS